MENPPQNNDDYDVFLSYKIKVNSGSVRNKTITNFQKKLYIEIKRLRKEGLSYNNISKYLNKVGWKTSRGNKFYGTNVWTFQNRIDRFLQLIESNDGVISTSFSNYQKNSVNFKDIPFELWEIKKFTNNIISFDQISSNSNESIDKVIGEKNKVIKNVNKEVKVFNEDDLLHGKSDNTKELYQDIKERVSQWDDVIFQPKKRYICIQKTLKKNIFTTFLMLIIKNIII